ncbi:MAG: winged helix-turn-helix domain-containing protein [Spirochaetaceae bacterium]|nr:MAG: winged helix-turn-helix domain-containing protein [Spirochaetaceae bacterium]
MTREETPMREISIPEARRLGLHRQGLLKTASFGRGKNAVARAIKQLGYVQIDTISVLDRAHHHVLKTRVPNYTEQMLDQLVRRDKRVFEYWSHAAAYLPLDEYRFYLPMMEGFRHSREADLDTKLAAEVIDRIRSEGPLQSKDFKPPEGHTSGGWWEWKPAKETLEHLFLSGQLMIAHREGFQKVFNLTENVLPGDIDISTPSLDEWYRFLVLRVVRGYGIATAANITTACRTVAQFVKQPLRAGLLASIKHLVAEGQLEPLRSGGQTWYTLPGALDELPSRLPPKEIRFLSPFDHAVIDRKRTSDLFDFEYQIECYVPEAKRRYGYYCLPILWGDELIGRMDAKAVRATGTFELRGLFLEPQVKLDERLEAALSGGIRGLAEANGCEVVEVVGAVPERLK